MRMTPETRARMRRIKSRISESIRTAPIPELVAPVVHEPFDPPPFKNTEGVGTRKPSGPVVYIARCGPFVKIGFSLDLEQRWKGLEGHNPYDIELVASFQASRVFERELHARFASVRHRYEWFREEGELAEWIEGDCPL